MKKRFITLLSLKFIILFLLPISVNAQGNKIETISITKEDALKVAEEQFTGLDVDYFILDDDASTNWNIFVDAEPMKGWEHD